MKKLASLLAAGALLLSLAACGGGSSSSGTSSSSGGASSGAASSGAASSGDSSEAAGSSSTPSNAGENGNLIVYTSLPESVTDPLIADFESKSGISVDLITAGGGELLSRIANESENPQGDVMLSGTISNCTGFQDYFLDYVTSNEGDVMDDYKNVEGGMTRFDVIASCLIVNKDLIGDIEVTGYESLLNPELKGKIAMADPAKSSSAFEHLVNMLEDMGDGNADNGWDYVKSFCEQLDGKLLDSSSAVYKGVADGEYVVGLTSEGSAANVIAAGADNVEIVYMTEGVILRGDGAYIIKGCPNEDNAKTFLDYCTSYDTQLMCQNDLCMRSVRGDVTGSPILADLSTINVRTDDLQTVIDSKDAWMDQFSETYIDLQA